MKLLLYIAIISIMIVLLGFMWRQHNRGRVHLISLRNVFLVGFIHMQLFSALWFIHDPYIYFRWNVVDLIGTGWKFVGLSVLFLVVLLIVYGRSSFVSRITSRLPVTRAAPSEGALLWLAVLLTITSALLWTFVRVPLLYAIARYVGTGLGSIACGLVAWVWIGRPKNPVLLAFLLIIFVLNALFPMTTYGRRALVSLAGGVVWAIYYRAWYRLRARKLVFRFAVLGIVPLLVIGLFTSVRGHRADTVGGVVSELRSGNLSNGVLRTVLPQDAGPASMWIIENFPQQVPYDQLFTIRAYFYYWVPRSVWPDKPPSLGQRLPDLAGMKRVGGLNVGPGIIGSGMAEGGVYAVVLYAVIFGFLLRLLDQAVVEYHYNLFLILPLGASLGEFVGMARGSTYWMCDLATITVMGTMVIMYVLGKVMQGFTPPIFYKMDATPRVGMTPQP